MSLPTTSISPVTSIVSKLGASADTSHEYLPDIVGSTALNVRWVAFDTDLCEIYVQFIDMCEKSNVFSRTDIMWVESILVVGLNRQ